MSVCDRIGSLRPRSRRGIWAPDRKSPNATIYRPGRSADSELGHRGGENKPEGVTISAMFGHPYPRPGEEISRRVEHDFRSL
ncbi:hypothetical protein Taro_006014 [Colocasia esculenta]|uniref:Uncharacterized protein n=1 Tax=Colocasia esculenta TaxID=4460 RepID=A0A843TWD1_COLES|nr:hypothetical protein [Colocasia esculenta]